MSAAEWVMRTRLTRGDLASVSDTSSGALLRELDLEAQPRSLPQFILLCWRAHRRAVRGQLLESQACVSQAIDVLLYLIRKHDDPRATRQQIETCDPALAHELLGIALGQMHQPEVRLLDLARERLSGPAPALCWEACEEVRRSIEARDET